MLRSPSIKWTETCQKHSRALLAAFGLVACTHKTNTDFQTSFLNSLVILRTGPDEEIALGTGCTNGYALRDLMRRMARADDILISDLGAGTVKHADPGAIRPYLEHIYKRGEMAYDQ